VGYVPDSTLRVCDWPACVAWYDAAEVMGGTAAAPGWLTLSSPGVILCGDHSGVWGTQRNPQHLVRLRKEKSACGCGFPLVGATLGELRIVYIAHLVEVAAGGSGTSR
jgi:hypothetical protein